MKTRLIWYWIDSYLLVGWKQLKENNQNGDLKKKKKKKWVQLRLQVQRRPARRPQRHQRRPVRLRVAWKRRCQVVRPHRRLIWNRAWTGSTIRRRSRVRHRRNRMRPTAVRPLPRHRRRPPPHRLVLRRPCRRCTPRRHRWSCHCRQRRARLNCPLIQSTNSDFTRHFRHRLITTIVITIRRPLSRKRSRPAVFRPHRSAIKPNRSNPNIRNSSRIVWPLASRTTPITPTRYCALPQTPTWTIRIFCLCIRNWKNALGASYAAPFASIYLKRPSIR